MQDRSVVERGVFDEETVPEELTQLRMGKIVKDRYPELTPDDQEAVRQHAVAALALTQKAKSIAAVGGGSGGDESAEANTNMALIEGVRRYATDMRGLDIDLIDKL